jgi:hypothetical protein
MKLSFWIDHYSKTAKRKLHNLGRSKSDRDFWTKYHELYLKGKFDLENRKHFLEEWFSDTVGYFPDIDNPKTFNEKIQWYKLYYHDPLIVKCIDKISFKDHIKETLGSEYVVPLLGVYSSADEIDFDALPDQFVIKANYGSDAKQIILVTDKSKMDATETWKTVSSWEKPWWRDAWGGYEFVQPKILVEKYVEQAEGQVYDYKFMCFNGEPSHIIFSTNRFKDQTIDYFDIDWKKLDMISRDHPNSPNKIERPKELSKMVEMTRTLSKQFPFVRADLYVVEERPYIGELTFYPGGGLNKYSHIERDYEMGQKLKLPERSKLLKAGS